MKASKYGKTPKGHGKFFVELGVQPECYTHGPYDDREEAEEEARQSCRDDERSIATIGKGEEVRLRLPDADDIIEQIREEIYDQCGDDFGYLDHHSVSDEQRDELSVAIEKTVAEWLTKHNLWPTFCKVKEVGTVDIDDPQATTGETK